MESRLPQTCSEVGCKAVGVNVRVRFARSGVEADSARAGNWKSAALRTLEVSTRFAYPILKTVEFLLYCYSYALPNVFVSYNFGTWCVFNDRDLLVTL